jgi:putative DNA primase/helicase
VHPVSRNKHPLTNHGFKDATHDCDQIEDWWRHWPEALISVPTGEATGIVVLDVDRKNQRDGAATLTEKGWTLPETWTSFTPSGGLHVYLRHPGREVAPSCDRVGSGLDIRGDKASIILPGYRDGYRWSRWRPGRCDIAPMPRWLVKVLRPPLSVKRPWFPRDTSEDRQIADACRAIGLARPGRRQTTMAAQAYRAGRLVAEERVGEDEAWDAVAAAVASVAGPDWSPQRAMKDAERCFRRGITRA